MRIISVLVLLLLSLIVQTGAQQGNDSIKNQTEEITITEAVEIALKNNPNLKAFEYELTFLEKQKIQAGLIPNPEANFEAEDFLGGKELSGFKGSQYTLSGSQLFELGGKRGSRLNLAETEIVSSKGEYELLKLDVIASVKSTFFLLFQIQMQIEQQRKFVELNEDILKTISERVKAGRTSPAEESKVKVALINSQIELQRLQRSYLSVQTRLNSLLGTTGKNLVPSTDLFENLLTPPNKENVLQDLENIPSIKNLNNETNIRKAQLELEESQAIPDLTASLGVRYLNELKTNSFVAGVSIPLPFFSRNQGNIQAAEVRLEQIDAIKNARRLNVIAKLNTANNNLLSSYNNSLQLKNNIIPEAENAYEITRQGYIQGRFAFIDLLDAQRTLFETQTQFLLELADYYNALIEIENITGKNLIK
ncbi:MAG: TolC family protein [Ignavibacteriota bacterium]|jgi:cobalt-zinc-cadmium efflux system outer membrane protein|nr:MAG: TolC family protein [Ignavibacterium sp.]MBL1155859.1 TolC family protein [Ignavibacteriota bacterium]MBV6420891.1 Cobalt-zinc-cadmium resistance protein CzcC [Ignavibacteriaceae bacterium]MCO6446837.1 TolC family protein [Ignavibacterium album]QQS37158.1 MAG: TolC family protein [Ignavibacteriales bacterium]